MAFGRGRRRPRVEPVRLGLSELAARVGAELGRARVVADSALPADLVAGLEAVIQAPVLRAAPGAPAPGLAGADPLVWVGVTLPERLPPERLLWFHSTDTGMDEVFLTGRWPTGALLTHSCNELAFSVSSRVAGAITVHAQQTSRRSGRPLPTSPPAGQLVVVLGTGAMGSMVADGLRWSHQHTVGVTSNPRPVRGFDRTVTLRQARGVLKEAQWVVAALPETPATRGLVGSKLFQAMGRVRFFQAGRGATVDLDALEQALHQEHVLSADLNVWPGERPPPPELQRRLPRTSVSTVSSHLSGIEHLVTDFQVCWDALRYGQLPWGAVWAGTYEF